MPKNKHQNTILQLCRVHMHELNIEMLNIDTVNFNFHHFVLATPVESVMK